MKKAKMNYILVIILIANVAGLNMLSLSARTPEKLLNDRLSAKNRITYISDRKKHRSTEFISMASVPVPVDGSDLTTSVNKYIVYPKEAINKGIEGQVKVICTVESNGSVSDVMVLEDIGGNCGQAVCQAVRKVQFKPALQNGHPTKYAMVVPVTFSLQH
jgi:TonB family protein